MSGTAAGRPTALRILSAAALVVILLAGVAQLPHQWRMFVQPALPIVRLWADADAQHRLQYADVSYDLLRAVEAAVPADATVLLVTSGDDVRGHEYRTFHRALYVLAPRPVWWQSPAPPDDTWESKWWISAPLDAAHVLSTAADHGADYVLIAADADLDLPGRRLLESSDGVLVQLDAGQPAPSGHPLASFQATGGWPLPLAGALLVIWAIGDALLALAARLNRQPPAGVQKLALTWILGSGLCSLALLSLDRLGLTLSQAAGILAALAAGWIAWRAWTGWRRHREPVDESRRARSAPPGGFAQTGPSSEKQPINRRRAVVAGVLVAVIGVQLLLAGVLAIGQPLAGWDSWTSWGMRARTIFLENGIAPAVYADPSRAVTRPGYPLLTPLLQAWLYRWLGAADDRLAGLVLWLFFAALVGLVYGALLRRSRDRVWALLAGAAAASIPWLVTLSGLAYVDGALAALALAAAAMLIDWLDDGQPGALLLAIIAFALMPWAKEDGLVIALVLLLAAVVICPPWRGRRGWVAALAGGCAALVVAAGWKLVTAGSPPAGAFPPLTAATLQANLGRIPTIWQIVRENLMSVDFALIWPVALIFGLSTLALPAVQRRAAWRTNASILPLATALYLCLMAAIYLFSSFQPYYQHVLSSYFRLASQVAPLAVLWIAYTGSFPFVTTAQASIPRRGG